MIVRRRHFRVEPGIHLTPLLTVFFCLASFYMLAATLGDRAPWMSVRTPGAATAASAANDANVPLILIVGDGRVFYKDRPVVREELILELNHAIRQGIHTARIRVDERVANGRVRQVWDWCKEAGIDDILMDDRPLSPADQPKLTE